MSGLSEGKKHAYYYSLYIILLYILLFLSSYLLANICLSTSIFYPNLPKSRGAFFFQRRIGQRDNAY